jgi:SAM-dependent methyltransferase
MDKTPVTTGDAETIPSLVNSWDRVAKLDALGVVLSERRKPHGTWDLDEFFSTGEREVSSVLNRCLELGIALKYGRGLDFGCGVGRLTRAFASRFSKCVGVDVSGEMVSQARELNKQFPNCEFVVNHSDKLPFPAESFDFVSSFIVLQHVHTEQGILNWITEFVRVLSPGGTVIFQLPDRPSLRRRIQGRRRLWFVLRFLGLPEEFLYEKLGLTPIKMNGVASDKVIHVLRRSGAEIIKVEEDSMAGANYPSFTYFGLRKVLP